MRKFMAAMCCLAALILGACGSAVEQAQQEPLLTIFTALEAEPLTLRLTGWEQIATKLLPQEGLEQRAQELSQKLGLTVTEQRLDSDDKWRQLRLKGHKEGRQYELTWQSLPGETYLIMDVQTSGEVACFEQLRGQLRQNLGEDCRFYALITAAKPGKLSDQELKRLCKKAVRRAKGEEVSAEGTDGYLCYSAYLAGAGPAAQLRGQEVNLQLVGNYNENQDCTYLYLGMPVVFSDY